MPLANDIGIFAFCHGYPGVGKTLSAWQYTKWHLIQPSFLIASMTITG